MVGEQGGPLVHQQPVRRLLRRGGVSGGAPAAAHGVGPQRGARDRLRVPGQRRSVWKLRVHGHWGVMETLEFERAAWELRGQRVGRSGNSWLLR